MMSSRLKYCLPAILLWLAAPATAAQGPAAIDSSSLSGSYLAGRYASKVRDHDLAAEYFAQALRDDPNNSVLIERTFREKIILVGVPRLDVARRVAARQQREPPAGQRRARGRAARS